MLQKNPNILQNKVEEEHFWDTAVPRGSKNSHNVVQLNPDEDKYYLVTPYPTLMLPLKSFHPKAFEL